MRDTRAVPGAGQVTWRKVLLLSQGKEPGQPLFQSAGAWGAAEHCKGQGSSCAVSWEPMILFLFCVNIPLVLLMGKKLNSNFLALSQKLLMPLDSGIGISLGRTEHFQCIPKCLCCSHSSGVHRASCPSCPSPFGVPLQAPAFLGSVLPFLQPRLSSMAWLPYTFLPGSAAA